VEKNNNGDWKEAGFNSNPLIDVKSKVDLETVGIYKGSREVRVDGKPCKIHALEVKGELKDFWGTGQLDYRLELIKPESEIKIVYLGKEKVKGIKQAVHQFKVFTREVKK
jgi:hypothetical protein